MNHSILLNMIFTGLIIIYGLFMLKLLHDVGKCENLTKSDKNFRHFAHIITYIALVLNSLYFLVLLYMLITNNDKL